MFQTVFSLKGKKALVTGSSRGIGKAVAFALGAAGAHVVFHASGTSPRLDETVAEARRNGIGCEAFASDISDAASVGTMMKALLPLDILVMNASVQRYMTLEEFDAAEFAHEFNTNVRAAFLMLEAVLPSMKARSFGRIISIGSVNQWKQSPRLAVYAATKSALVNMILNCARSYAKFGITANNIAPGVISTDRNRETLSDPEAARNIMSLIPAGRFGTPEDCAGLALLLASDAGAYITGADIAVAGGMQL